MATEKSDPYGYAAAGMRVSEMSDDEIRAMVASSSAPRGDAKVEEVAAMIADWYGRSTEQHDRELAWSIICRLNRS